MDFIQQKLIDPVSTVLWTYVLVYVLVAAGVYFTHPTWSVQLRYFGRMLNDSAIPRSRRGYFVVPGVPMLDWRPRVGTGNIAGVAIAPDPGGPGAVFWMWVVAAATAPTEATPAAARPAPRRAAPAAVRLPWPAARRRGRLAVLLPTFGIAFNMVQAPVTSGCAQGAQNTGSY